MHRYAFACSNDQRHNISIYHTDDDDDSYYAIARAAVTPNRKVTSHPRHIDVVESVSRSQTPPTVIRQPHVEALSWS
jgi:hypothetical protein